MNTEKTIATIIRTLTAGGEQIPLRRAMRMCLTQLDELRQRGLTWQQIAMQLTKAGARHKKGQAISAHQLRTEYNRLISHRNKGVVKRAAPEGLKNFGYRNPAFFKSGARETMKDSPQPTPSSPANARLRQLTSTRRSRLNFDD